MNESVGVESLPLSAVSSSDLPAAAPAAKRGVWAILKPVNGTIRLAMAMAALGISAALLAVVAFAGVIQALVGDPALAGLLPAWPAWVWVLVAAGLIISSFLLRTLAFHVSHLGAFRLEQQLRAELAEHIARLPLGQVFSLGTGTLTKIMQDDVRALHAFVADSTPLFGRNLAAPVVALVLLVLIDWRLTLVVIGVFGLGMIFMRLAMKDYETLRRRYDLAQEKINTAVIEFVQAMLVVRTFDDGSTSFQRYHQALVSFRDIMATWIAATGLAARVSLTVLSPLPTLLAVSAIGIVLYSQGWLSFAVLVAMLLLATGLADALLPLIWLLNFIRKAESGALRIQDLLALPPLPEPSQPQLPADASVVFDNVDFRYPDRTDTALSNLSFSVPPGTVTALVGPSGAGKSTVARLIPRFWDVQSGAVRIGGVDVRDCATAQLMQQVSFVFQDTFLFHDSIANNIRMARFDASDAEVEAAARAAQAHDFISALPQGYATLCGDRGERLSGGERQRITIARAILRNAPILVLDEATAAADPENEALIIEALAELMRGKTVIVIAHRLSTITQADQIVVLERGAVVECGVHQELLQAGGLYATLWRNHEQAQSWILQRSPEETVS